ncbi:hypothetical protein DFH11DRAFT_1786493 [Phellopilus nigrolimitatus]|nr:hypothetical protein DFH11DRAFT_1786493 [Phellopilus nigrolimitatus]
MSLADDNSDIHGLNNTAKPSVRTAAEPTSNLQAAYLVPEQRSRPPATPKRAGSPSSSAQEIRRVKLTVPEQNQGVAPVDPDNAPGKPSELEPVPSGDIVNLPTEPTADAAPETGGSAKVRLWGEGDEDGGDVSMGEGGDDDADSGDDNDDEDPAQLEACAAASACSLLPGLVLAHGHCAELLKRSCVIAAAWLGRAKLRASAGGSFGSGGLSSVNGGRFSSHADLCACAHICQHVAPTLKYMYNAKETKGNGGEMREIVVLVVRHDEHDYLGVARGGGSRRRVLMATRSRVDHRRGQRRRSARGDAAIGDDE